MWKKGEHVTIDQSNIHHIKFDKAKAESTNALRLQDVKVNIHARGETNKGWVKSKKERLHTSETEKGKEKPELGKWQKDCNSLLRSIGCRFSWDEMDFQILTNDALKGFKAYLNDKHIHVAHTMLANKFPDIKGLQMTQLYQTNGFDPTLGKPFIQVVHAGHSHWALLTNIGLDGNRENTLIMYDSFLDMTKGRNNICIPPRIVWQACQLLKRPQLDSYIKPICIEVRPCMQQTNGWDCGILAIANALAVAHNEKPEELD